MSDKNIIHGLSQMGINNRSLNCDQIHEILETLDRYLPKNNLPLVSRLREMTKYSMLYEIMDIAELTFEDDKAIWNSTPNDVRLYSIEKNN